MRRVVQHAQSVRFGRRAPPWRRRRPSPGRRASGRTRRTAPGSCRERRGCSAAAPHGGRRSGPQHRDEADRQRAERDGDERDAEDEPESGQRRRRAAARRRRGRPRSGPGRPRGASIRGFEHPVRLVRRLDRRPGSPLEDALDEPALGIGRSARRRRGGARRLRRRRCGPWRRP